jgi:predicted alpha/beta superfamily hydrolase
LRERIPYKVCKSIISGAGYDVLYLCDVEKAIPYLTEDDLIVLADCNCWIDDDIDSIALFV